jgi:ubiquinone/menaquinone biosynthesis C-methylase UbiE
VRSLLVLALAAACSTTSSTPAAQPAPAPSPPPAREEDRHAHHQHHEAQHHFRDPSRWAKIFDDPSRAEWQRPDRVVELLALAPGMSVADLGAGTGYFESRLSAAVGPKGKVLALDLEHDMVVYMRERAAREGTTNVEVRASAADDPLIAAASMDRILIVNTWHHLPARGAYAKKLAASLKPGGFVLVVDFTLAAERGPPKQHRVAPDAVIAELAQGGLRGELVEAGLPDQYVIKASK